MRSRLLAACVLGVAVVASAAVAAPAEEVTLKVNRFYDPACRCYRIEFSGAISSGAANEYVTVMQQRCGFRFSTAVAGATTREGGVWTAMPSSAPLGSGTFRARWKDHLSEPVTSRSPVRLFLSKQRGRRYRISVGAEGKLRSPIVELQRLAGGRWTRVRRIRLDIAGQAGYGGAYWATFSVRKRGLTMRIFVPAETAAPCYEATASQTFVS